MHENFTLSCEEAYARFSREAQACYLKSRCAMWWFKQVVELGTRKCTQFLSESFYHSEYLLVMAIVFSS